MIKKVIYSSILIFLFQGYVNAQELTDKKIWVSGYARSILLNDDYENQTEPDSVSAKKTLNGHTLLDLALNMKTSKNVFIHGEVRVRNDFGGFWGSGVSFDLRNLYLRGVVSDAFRYQIGDVNYKLTPYTFYNPDEEFSSSEPKIFALQRDMNRHDLFYTDDNTWRQQGATGEFGLNFKKYIKELDFNLFTTRLSATEGGSSPERLFAGASLNLKQSAFLDAQLTYVETFEIEGTGTTEDSFNNNVLSGGVGLHKDFSKWNASIISEFGQSNFEKVLSGDELIKEDHFSDVSLKIKNEDEKLKVNINFQDVGSGFRSIGAQTKRINFGANPRAYGRYGNEQNVRNIGFIDMLRDASLYNARLSTSLMAYNPSYGNFQPYGKATPNRRNLSVEAGWTDSKDFVDLNAKIIMGKEIVGEGTPELREFNTLNAKVEFHLDELSDVIKKDVDLQFELWSEATNRSGENEFEKIDLQNDMLSIGLNVGLWDEFELLFGVRTLTSVGNEFNNRNTILGEIVTFTPFDIDFTEQVISTGIRYNFSEKSLLNLQWTGYETSDKLELAEDYSISSWSVVYQIKF